MSTISWLLLGRLGISYLLAFSVFLNEPADKYVRFFPSAVDSLNAIKVQDSIPKLLHHLSWNHQLRHRQVIQMQFINSIISFAIIGAIITITSSAPVADLMEKRLYEQCACGDGGFAADCCIGGLTPICDCPNSRTRCQVVARRVN